MHDNLELDNRMKDRGNKLADKSVHLLTGWRSCVNGPLFKAVKRGGVRFTSLQVVIVATGEGTLIFFTWQISNIMYCQIILNTTGVTRRPCSQYSDLLWLINPAATTCHWTINHDDLHLSPTRARSLTLLHLSAHLNMRWRLDGSQKISLWESTAWQRCLHVREIWLRNMHACASGCDAPFSPQTEAVSWFCLHVPPHGSSSCQIWE